MKAWGAIVTTTCSTDAVTMVSSLGADHVIDYKTQNVQQELMNMKGYVVLSSVSFNLIILYEYMKLFETLIIKDYRLIAGSLSGCKS